MGEDIIMNWKYFYASAKGTSHQKSDTPKQDNCTVKSINVSGINYLISIVSDGAGSAEHSDKSSKYLCNFFTKKMSKWLKSNEILDFTKETVYEWIDNYQKILERAVKLFNYNSTRVFASTFLFCVLSEKGNIFMQIGDGAICVEKEIDKKNTVEETLSIISEPESTDKNDDVENNEENVSEEPVSVDNDTHTENEQSDTKIKQDENKLINRSFECVFKPQNGEFLNTTHFITEPIYKNTLMLTVSEDVIYKVAMFTDGIELIALDMTNMKPHEPFFKPFFSALEKCQILGNNEKLSVQLASFLNSERVNQKSDDDKTLVLIVATDLIEIKKEEKPPKLSFFQKLLLLKKQKPSNDKT